MPSASPAATPLDALRQSNAGLRRTVLDNGAVCLVKEDRSAPVVSVQIWVGTGSIHEQEYLGAGLSHYLEHMLFKGTETRPVGQITKEIDAAGGRVNAYTSYDRTVYYCDLPSRNWRTGVDVLLDAVLNASLPAEEWAREKDVILREMAMGDDDPNRVFHKLLFSSAFTTSPYQHPVIGHREVFTAMTRDDLLKYYQRRYTPDRMIAVVVGDVEAAAVEARLKETLGKVARRAAAPVVLPQEPAQVAPREARQTAPINVARLGCTFHTVTLSHPDAPALDLLASIVGHGRSSRLPVAIKERLQLAHEIDAFSFTAKDTGLFGITALYDADKEPELSAAIDREIAGWLEQPFTREEIAKARRQVIVNELGGLQTMSGQASGYGSGEFYAANPRHAEFYVQELESITPERLREVARKYLTPVNRTRVVLAPEGTATNAATATTSGAVATNLVRVTLADGTPLIVREDHRLPFVYCSAIVGGGLLAENADNNGVTQLAAELLTRGTHAHSAEQIAEKVEELGGSLSAYAGRNTYGLNAHALTSDLEAIFGLWAECFLHSTFPADEIEKQRAVQLASIDEQREKPMFIAQEALRETLFPNHPYRFDPRGTTSSVARLTREQVAAHHRALAVRGNVALAVFGDITPDKARALAEKHFAKLPAGPAPALTNPAPAATLPVRVERRQPRQQAIVLLGWPGPDIRDPRTEPLFVLQRALSGLSSDMMIEIRDKRGLAYYGGASGLSGLQTGMVMLYCGTQAGAVDEVEMLMRAESERAATAGLRDDEWQRAREQLLADLAMDLQDNGGLAQSCAVNELLGLGYRHDFERTERLAAMTAGQIKDAARSLFLPAREAVVHVLPEKNENPVKVKP